MFTGYIVYLSLFLLAIDILLAPFPAQAIQLKTVPNHQIWSNFNFPKLGIGFYSHLLLQVSSHNKIIPLNIQNIQIVAVKSTYYIISIVFL